MHCAGLPFSTGLVEASSPVINQTALSKRLVNGTGVCESTGIE